MKSKYDLVKEYVEELADMEGFTDKGIRSVKEVMQELDKAEQSKLQQKERDERSKMARADFEKMGYNERVELKRSNPDAYKNAVAGNFKEEK